MKLQYKPLKATTADGIKLLIVVLLWLITIAAFCQPTKELDHWCDNNIHQLRVPSDRADWLAQQLIRAYHWEGDDGVDNVLNKSDSSWYSGLDLYLAGGVAPLIKAMNNDLDATYRDTSIKRATVKVAYDGRIYMVLIVSYR